MFCTNIGELSDVAPGLSAGEAAGNDLAKPVQVDPVESRGRLGSGRIGALTGLSLPQSPGYQGNAGPEIPPLRTGLPHTPLAALQELMLAIAVQGLADDDLDYVISPTFMHHLLYVGLDPDVALKVKIKYLRGEIDSQGIKTAIYC